MQERSITPEVAKSDSSSHSGSETTDDSLSYSTWSGTSIQDLYRNNSPWNYYIPNLSPSRHHTVLFKSPVNLSEPPKPYATAKACHWNQHHVRMPFSSKNVFPVKENEEEDLKPRWDIIQCALLQNIKNSYELEEAISSYHTKKKRFYALHEFFEEGLDEEESEYFFRSLLPKIVSLALQLPELILTPIPLLSQGRPHSISLSRQQISSLLANAFLCTFPSKKDKSPTYPLINFNKLFECMNEPSVGEKLKCIIHYFRRVCTHAPVGVMTFERRHVPRTQFPRWDRSQANISKTKLHISSTGTIEKDGAGMLQVDFANSFIGGGVIGYGCVQEEIRFVICPELLVSLLFTEQLDAKESLLMIGAECYSNYSGYASTFQWAGNHEDGTPYDDFGRRKTSIIAIDALFYGRSSSQFAPSKMLRELNKAYVGFYEPFSNSEADLAPIATGNWGCGAFQGNLHLKAIIQLMAARAAHRNLVYYTFGDKKLQYAIYNIYQYLAANDVTIVQLWRYLCSFADTKLSKYQLLPYIKQSHIDSLNQPDPKPSFSNKYFTRTSPVKEKTSPKSPTETSSTNHESQPSTSTATHSKEITPSPTEEDLIVDASQEDIFELQAMTPRNSKIKSKVDPPERRKKKPVVDIVSFFYPSDDEEPVNRSGGKLECFLDDFDEKLAVKKVSSEDSKKCGSSTMDVSDDELMEVCVEDPKDKQPKKKEEKQKTPTKNKSSSNRKSLITDYFK